jgi:hypothetical protein
MTNPLALIASRRREIEAEITKLSAEIDALRAELPDLEAAERVLARLGAPDAGQGRPVGELAPAPRAETVAASTAKPPGTPTITDMILTALQDARSRGLRGLEPKEMTAFIAKRWWPNVPGVAISPIAWRMAKQGNLTKDGSLYILPQNTEAADLLSRAGSAASKSNPSGSVSP